MSKLVNKVIKNSNGHEYFVIEEKGNYTLLKDLKSELQPYVVAYGLQEFESGYSWGNGTYFGFLEYAVKCFRDKTN